MMIGVKMADGNEVTHEEIRFVLILNNADLHYLQPETAHRSPP